jgi:hypothetical protein
MGLHQIKEFLHIKGNNYQKQETFHRREENFYQLVIGLISRISKEL